MTTRNQNGFYEDVLASLTCLQLMTVSTGYNGQVKAAGKERNILYMKAKSFLERFLLDYPIYVYIYINIVYICIYVYMYIYYIYIYIYVK